MPLVRPKEKRFVVTEADEALNVVPVMGMMVTPSGAKLQVKRAWANIPSGSTDVELVPAAAGAVIRILDLFMVSGGTATDVTLNSKGVGAGVAISPLIANAANGGAVLPFNSQGWFQGLDLGESITVTTSAGSATGILVQFVEIPSDAFNLL